MTMTALSASPIPMTLVVDAASLGWGEMVAVPSAEMLTQGDYSRSGPDLVILAPDGAVLIVENYFTLVPPPALVGPGGEQIPGSAVTSLAGGQTPIQVAEAGDGALGWQQVAQAAEPIGTVGEMDGPVTVIRADGTVVDLAVGDAVYMGDVVQTGPGGVIGIVFVDETEFSLGANGRMVLDELVYDPATGSGSSNFTLVSGAFSFVSGQLSKSSPDAMKINTPVATIGIRGTTGTIEVRDEGGQLLLRAVLLPDPTGTTGELLITTFDGQVTTLNIPFNGLNFQPGQPLQTFTTTQQEIQEQYGTVIQYLRSQVEGSATGPQGQGQGQPGDAAPQEEGQEQGPGPGQEGDGGPSDGAPPSDEQGQAPDDQQPQGEQQQGEQQPPPPEAPAPTPPKPIQVTEQPKTDPQPKEGLSGGDTQGSTSGAGGSGGGGSSSSSAPKGVPQTAPPPSSNEPEIPVTPPVTTTPVVVTPPPPQTVSLGGHVVDFYVAGATVFVDLNNNGVLDSGEPYTVSGAGGEYTLTTTGSVNGPIIAVGGIDIGTGQAMNLVLTAPAGSTVVTPLTTMMYALTQPPSSLTPAQAQAEVGEALGLDLSSITLNSYDPVAAVDEGSSLGAQITAAGVLVANTVAMMSAVLAGAGASSTALASITAFQALATASTTGQPGFLTQAEALKTIVSAAASSAGVTLSSTALDNVAATMSSVNTFFATQTSGKDGANLMLSLAQGSLVAQGQAASALKTSVETNSTETLASDYDQSALTTAYQQVLGEVGTLPGGTPDPDPEPEPELGPEALLALQAVGDFEGITFDFESVVFQGNANVNTPSAVAYDAVNFGTLNGVTYAMGPGVALATGPVNLTSTTPGTSLSGVASGSSWPIGQQGVTSTDATAITISFTVEEGVEGILLDWMFGSEEYPSQSVTDFAGIFLNGENLLALPDGGYVGWRSGTSSYFSTSGALATAYNGMIAPSLLYIALDPTITTHTLSFVVTDTSDSILDSILFVSPRGLVTEDGLSSLEGLPALGASLIAGTGDSETLNGTDGADLILGAGGDDIIVGSLGNDTIYGGSGNNTIDYSAAEGTMTVNLSTGVASGMGTDSLNGIQVVIGGSGNDVITGNAEDNTLIGGTGNNTLNGGGGSNTVSYAWSDAGIGVFSEESVGAWTVYHSPSNENTDTLTNIQTIIGTDHGDYFEVFSDALEDMTAAGIVLNGGLGSDTLYFHTSDGFTLDLTTVGLFTGFETLDFSSEVPLSVSLIVTAEAVRLLSDDNILRVIGAEVFSPEDEMGLDETWTLANPQDEDYPEPLAFQMGYTVYKSSDQGEDVWLAVMSDIGGLA